MNELFNLIQKDMIIKSATNKVALLDIIVSKLARHGTIVIDARRKAA